jgi:hypothetical protein
MNLGSARASTEDWKLTIERDKLTKAGYTSIFREKVCRAYRDRPELSPHARSIAQGRRCHRLEAWPTGEFYPQSPRRSESDRQPRGPVSVHLRAPGPISPCMPARCDPLSSSLAHGATESYLIHLHELTTACGTQVRVRGSVLGVCRRQTFCSMRVRSTLADKAGGFIRFDLCSTGFQTCRHSGTP